MAPEIVNVGLEPASPNRVGIHRMAIVNVACKVFGTEPHILQRYPKSVSPWNHRAAVIAGLLKRDTDADDAVIAAIVGCPTREVRFLLDDLAKELEANNLEIMNQIADINDGVLDIIGDNGIVWHRQLAPAKSSGCKPSGIDPRIEEICAVITKQVKGASAPVIRSSTKFPDIVRARYIAIAIFVYRYRREGVERVANLFNKHSATVEKACKVVRATLAVASESELKNDLRALLPEFGISDEAAFRAGIVIYRR